jgi:hypothetical protein
MSDERSADAFLAVDKALEIVSREKKIPREDLRGSILATGDVRVLIKVRSRDPGVRLCRSNGWQDDFMVTTLRREQESILEDIVVNLESDDPICDSFHELDVETIFGILVARVDVEELRPWIVSYAREFTRELGHTDHERFWRLCGKVGLSPGVAPGIEEDVSPSYTLIKDLQGALIPYLLADPRAVLAGKDGEAPFFDNDLMAACEILLDQCNFDLKVVAADLLKAMGGVQGYLMDDPLTVTSDGYVIFEC